LFALGLGFLLSRSRVAGSTQSPSVVAKDRGRAGAVTGSHRMSLSQAVSPTEGGLICKRADWGSHVSWQAERPNSALKELALSVAAGY
jgi:hypothetical protein